MIIVEKRKETKYYKRKIRIKIKEIITLKKSKSQNQKSKNQKIKNHKIKNYQNQNKKIKTI
jgi:hypothetical protein